MKTILQFSGGRDSLACLHLYEPSWDDITVMWCNTGAAFPETLAQMDEIRALVPHFVEVKSVQTIEANGYPVDVLPVASTVVGQIGEGTREHKFQSRLDCCAQSIWFPLYRATRDLGAKVVIRGQKRCDAKKGPLRSGDVVEGIRYEYPIEAWTDTQVVHYLESINVPIPRNYRFMTTGLDCWNCTGYLSDNVGKLDYMQRYHPEKHALVQDVLSDLSQTLHRDLSPLRDIKANYS